VVAGKMNRLPWPHTDPGNAASRSPDQLGAAVVVESFVGLGQQPTASVERIVFVAAVADGLVLDASAALIDLGRVGDANTGACYE
jgi:hypothetical protein